MNLEDRLNRSLNEILRTSGYVFEIINNNKRQSNLVAGPNNQLIPPPMMEQLAQRIAGFESILDETVAKFNDVPWCIDQIIENKKKEELERQQREEDERRRKEKEEAAMMAEKARKEQEERLALEREKQMEAEREKKRAEDEKRAAEERKRELEKEKISSSYSQPDPQNYQNFDGLSRGGDGGAQNDIMDSNFDLDMDLDKDLGVPNPADILSNFKDSNGTPSGKENGSAQNADGTNLGMNMGDMNDMMKGGDSLLDGLDMDLLGEDFGDGLGGPTGEEEFDVENFLSQFGNGD